VLPDTLTTISPCDYDAFGLAHCYMATVHLPHRRRLVIHSCLQIDRDAAVHEKVERGRAQQDSKDSARVMTTERICMMLAFKMLFCYSCDTSSLLFRAHVTSAKPSVTRLWVPYSGCIMLVPACKEARKLAIGVETVRTVFEDTHPSRGSGKTRGSMVFVPKNTLALCDSARTFFVRLAWKSALPYRFASSWKSSV
jgi:hypothetical protein